MHTHAEVDYFRRSVKYYPTPCVYVIITRQNRVKGSPAEVVYDTPVEYKKQCFTPEEMMSVNRLILSKSAQIRQLLCTVKHAGKHVVLQRNIRTHSRNLAYAKDLFLGQVNKVRVYLSEEGVILG